MKGTGKQKMLAGELYRPADDPELVADLLRAQELLDRFNGAKAAEGKERLAILSQLFGGLGDGTVVNPPFRCDYGFNIVIGRSTFINYGCIFLDCNRIVIGNDVQIGPAVQIYTAGHPIDVETRRSGLEFALPVTIGDDVWLGGGTIVCPGVTIGAGTVVGAGSVVTRDLPAGVVAVGNPCRAIRVADELRKDRN